MYRGTPSQNSSVPTTSSQPSENAGTEAGPGKKSRGAFISLKWNQSPTTINFLFDAMMHSLTVKMLLASLVSSRAFVPSSMKPPFHHSLSVRHPSPNLPYFSTVLSMTGEKIGVVSATEKASHLSVMIHQFISSYFHHSALI